MITAITVEFLLLGGFESVISHLASAVVAPGFYHNVKGADAPAVPAAMRVGGVGSGLQIVEEACTTE